MPNPLCNEEHTKLSLKIINNQTKSFDKVQENSDRQEANDRIDLTKTWLTTTDQALSLLLGARDDRFKEFHKQLLGSSVAVLVYSQNTDYFQRLEENKASATESDLNTALCKHPDYQSIKQVTKEASDYFQNPAKAILESLGKAATLEVLEKRGEILNTLNTLEPAKEWNKSVERNGSLIEECHALTFEKAVQSFTKDKVTTCLKDTNAKPVCTPTKGQEL